MRYLKTNTATRITVGPFLDKTDGITPEVALTATNEKLTLMVDDGGVPTLVLDANATASGGNNDMVHVTNDDAGFYDLELTAAQLNYVGRAMLSINYVTDHCPVFHEFMILSAQAYDAMCGSGYFSADAKAIGGTAQTGRDIGASVLLSSGTGTGQLDITSGVVKANLVQILATTLTETAGYLAAGFKQFFNIASPTSTMNTITAVTTATNLTNAPTAGDLTATMKTSVTTAASAATPALSAAGVSAIWAALTSGMTTASSIGKKLADWVVGTIDTYTGNTKQTGDAYARLGAPSGASVSADIAAVKSETATILADTNELQTDLVNGGRLDLLIDAIKAKTDNLPSDPADQSAIEAAITSATSTLATSAALATVAGYVDTEVAAIKAKTDNLPASPASEATLATIAGYVDTEVAAIKAVTDKLDTALELDSTVYRFTTNALENSPSGSTPPTAAAIADAVWDELLSGHSTAGTAGLALATASSGGVDPSVLADAIWDEALSGHSTAGTAGKKLTDLTNADLSAILADTNELQTDLANGGRLDLLIDAIKAKTDNLPTDPADQSAIEAAITAATSPLATSTALATVAGYVDTEVAAIKAKTDNLPASPASEATLATIAGYIDTEVAAIKAKTDNLPSDPADQSAVEAAITAATSPLATSTALATVAGYVDTEVAAIKAVTDKLDTALELDNTVYRFTANSLEQAPTGGGSDITVQDVVNGVLDELLSGHTTAGSVGAGIAAAGSAGDPWSTALPGAYASGTAGYIIGNNMSSPGSGSTPWPYRLEDDQTRQPIAGAAVRATTDAAGTITVAAGTTDANGYVTFNLDPGTYYIWRSKTGYTFADPDTEVVS